MDKKFILFNISGGIGTFLFYLFYEKCYEVLDGNSRQASLAWIISYGCSIWWQHLLHRVLVYGSGGRSYWSSLIKTYLSYSVSLILSSILTDILTNRLNIHYKIAWVIGLVVTGFLNFYLVSKAFESKVETKQK